MIEVTDEMKNLSEGFERSGNYAEDVAKRIIELHEQSKPKPEPYCYISENTGECVLPHELPEDLKTSGRWKPLYTAPPTREPLSNNELLRIFEKMPDTGMGYYTTFARAVEKAHGIGVTK